MKTYDTEGFSRRRMAMAAMLGATALATPLTPAFAQDTAPSVDETTIIVTAQRRNEALEDVPMSVAVLTADTMAAAGINSLRDIANVAPGVALSQGGFVPQPTIRGVTTTINGTYENNVAVYVDGLYQPVAQTINIDLPNVESMEILKGPQGTLYGRNATGGAILINTIRPSDVWEGKAELTYAAYDDKRASGYVAGPLSDMFGISAAGYIRRSDGYVEKMSRTVPGRVDGDAAPLEQDSAQLKLTGDFTDTFRATLGYRFSRISDGRGNMFSPLENVSPALAPAYDRMPRKLGQAAYDIGTEISTKQHEGSLTLELDTGIGTLKSITGYAEIKARTSFDFDGSYLNGAWSTSLMKQETFQQALDFNVTAVENLDLIVGGTYFNDKLNFDEPNTFYQGSGTNPGFVEVPLANYLTLFKAYFNQKKEAWAVYADATFHATDELSINVGGRYSEEDQDVSGRQDGLLPIVSRPQNDKSASFSKFTPRASIRYEIAPRTNIYGTYSKGFRSGAFNSQIPINPADWKPADQETIDAFELGFKTAGSNFRFEAAAFYYDYKDLQVSSTVTSSSGSPIVLITNAPKAKIKGIEASGSWEPVDNLTISAGAIYLHARYGDGFTLDTVGVATVNNGVASVPALNLSSDPLKSLQNRAQVQDLSGKQMSRAPDFSANIGVDYLAETADGSLRLAANAKYTDSYVVTNPAVWCQPLAANNNCAGIPDNRRNQQRFRQSGYVLVNLSVTYTDPSDHIFVRAWANNILDERYRMHYTGNTSWGSYSPMAEPLTYGLTAGYKF